AHYAAKFDAYYAYRETGEASRDYDGFPTLLFVTTEDHAETRIAEEALRAWHRRGGEPLPIFITAAGRIRQHREGILGPVWRSPSRPELTYWLPGGPPRGLFGVGRRRVDSPQLVWQTGSDVQHAAVNT